MARAVVCADGDIGDIGVGISDIQGREDVEGYRESGSRVMTLRRQSTATGTDANRLYLESSRLLYDDEHSANCRAGAGKTHDGHKVDS